MTESRVFQSAGAVDSRLHSALNKMDVILERGPQSTVPTLSRQLAPIRSASLPRTAATSTPSKTAAARPFPSPESPHDTLHQPTHHITSKDPHCPSGPAHRSFATSTQHCFSVLGRRRCACSYSFSYSHFNCTATTSNLIPTSACASVPEQQHTCDKDQDEDRDKIRTKDRLVGRRKRGIEEGVALEVGGGRVEGWAYGVWDRRMVGDLEAGNGRVDSREGVRDPRRWWDSMEGRGGVVGWLAECAGTGSAQLFGSGALQFLADDCPHTFPHRLLPELRRLYVTHFSHIHLLYSQPLDRPDTSFCLA
ncbi:hypothetical protein M427DRAFT_71537 [Gonapodya prolifera JEL478]|uniref:Uncharacterized protein n=1 Tax=Gonapodya prolifera (strain JEL478) TaxID=1344416 RepID=A0A139A957_GONPJ|nr:hypothetical protein M427DRAFT_71537 [Gonapodya prolifera JEL478]|eukprot:KXS13330.1 hypothetical protein M427DRAFT_71537 [Gonapodya prolifera JEL478]